MARLKAAIVLSEERQRRGNPVQHVLFPLSLVLYPSLERETPSGAGENRVSRSGRVSKKDSSYVKMKEVLPAKVKKT
jgi:hypothetical protein